MSHIWVIEELFNKKWKPYTYRESRSSARELKQELELKTPQYKLRIKKYIREDTVKDIVSYVISCILSRYF